MGEIFEKLLLTNEVVTKEELEHYKNIAKQNPKKTNLANLLIEKGLITPDIVQKFLHVEQENKKKDKLSQKQIFDQKLIQIIQKLGIVGNRELANCLKELKQANEQGKILFLADILINRGYLTKYLIKKIADMKVDFPEEEMIESLVLNIPQYLRDRFLGKIILKNNILNGTKFAECWESLKRAWPNKGLAEILLSKNLLSEGKIKTLLQILKKNITKKYPFFDAQIRDWELAKLLAKRHFLSSGRLNKCLTKQLDEVKKKKYVPLREILVEQGYLTNYIFDTVLKAFGALVSCDPPGTLVPSEEIRILTKQAIAGAIQEAKSDVHLIIEESDIATIQLHEDFLKHAEVTSEVIELNDSAIEGDIQEIQQATTSTKNKGRSKKEESAEAIFKDFEAQEKILTPDRIALIPEEEIEEEDFLDIDVEDEDLDIDLGADAQEFVAEDFSDQNLRKIETTRMQVKEDHLLDDTDEDDLGEEVKKLPENKSKANNTEDD